MKVTPVKKKFGKYSRGDVFDFPDKAAKVFIRVGKLEQVPASQHYQTRMMTAEIPSGVPGYIPPMVEDHPSTAEVKLNQTLSDAPYGYKADGTPRKRPGRQAAK